MTELTPHETKQFTFVDKDRKEFILTSKPFSFYLDSIITQSFGKDAIDKYIKEHRLEVIITEEQIKKDFPLLLDGDIKKFTFEVDEYLYK